MILADVGRRKRVLGGLARFGFPLGAHRCTQFLPVVPNA